MRTVMTAIALFCAGLVTGSLAIRHAPSAAATVSGTGAGFREAASENGDVNCDGEVQLSDAVFILNWLFLGGRSPCPLADPPELLARVAELESALDDANLELNACNADLKSTSAQLAATESLLAESVERLFACETDLHALQEANDRCEGELLQCERATVAIRGTGQKMCFDDVGTVIDCGSPEYPGQDGFYQFGCPPEGRFLDNGDGTVTDICTGLMWQKNVARPDPEYGPDEQAAVTWQQALLYCEETEFAGYSDWRLPSPNELLGMALLGVGADTSGLAEIFSYTVPGSLASLYWASTTCEVACCPPGFQAMYVHISRRAPMNWNCQDKITYNHVRPVRGP